MKKNYSKKLTRGLARYAFYFFRWLFTHVPYPAVEKMTRGLLNLAYALVRRHRKSAAESLRIAFGNEKSEAEIQEIMRTNFDNLGKGAIEIVYFTQHPEYLRNRFYFEGREHLDAALKEGRGVIGVTAHFGNFPLMFLRFAQEGYKVNGIIRSARDEIIEKDFQETRTRMGLNTIYAMPRKECVDKSIRVLRNNEILFIPIDQNFGSKAGVYVDFFGQPAATATGPVVFAQRTKAPILPVFTIREKGDMHKIIIEKPMHLEEKATDRETIIHNTQRFTKVIENYIRKYPHEWSWMHRRWKNRPKDEGQPATIDMEGGV